MAYTRGRNETIAPELPIIESDAAYAGRDRAALVLTSIGQVWGDTNLINFIGEFYRTAAKAGKPVTAAHFGAQLDRALPDSLRYLTTYLRQRVYFEFQIGRVSQLPNLVAVQIIGHKWQNDAVGERQETLMADYVPVVLLDANGRECYRTLIVPGSGQQDEPISLPVVAGATEVVIDPLGAWRDNQADNHKRLARSR